MTYETQPQTITVTAVAIETMQNMTSDQYQTYVESGLVSVDHHGILRSEPAGYPLATSKEQFKVLLAHLKSLEHKIGE